MPKTPNLLPELPEPSGNGRFLPELRSNRGGEDLEVELPDDEPTKFGETTENEDGSALVTLEDEELDFGDSPFDTNMAEMLPPEYLGGLGLELVEAVQQDIESREGRDKQYKEGIARSGLTGTQQTGNKGADFEGASTVVHPMLAKASIEFASRAIKELFPANGPCKTEIVGEQTEAKLDKADRKKTYMNWQCTTQVEENRAVLERVLSQVPMGGAMYKRWYFDKTARRARTEPVFIDNVFTPPGDSDFYTSSRVTHRQYIRRETYEQRIAEGLYRDLDLADAAFFPGTTDESRAQAASDKVEGVDPQAANYNDDGLRPIYQVDVLLDCPLDNMTDGPAPYVLHIDVESEAVLGMYRNWKEGDATLKKKHHMSEWSFIPWRSGPALGFTHVIGSLSVAATGALRALMDSAHIRNFPGAMVLGGAKASGQNVQVNATEFVPIAAVDGDTSPDIRKLVMSFPFNEPSSVLYQLLEWITAQGESVVATASEKIADGGADMPVGTAMALIEHGSANFRAIHARLHESMKRDLQILHRLDAENLRDEETVEELGELVVYREDFQGPMDVAPVSDPNIFSEAQRYAQIQAVLQLKADPQFAPFFKHEQMLGRILRLMNVPDIEGITNLPKEAKKLTAIRENYALASGDRPLKVYAEQDDVMHLKVHVMFATSPMFGANPMVAAGIVAPMLQHCKEHILALYRKHTEASLEATKAVYEARGMLLDETNNDEIILQAAAQAEQQLAKELGDMVMPGMQQMQQQVAASQPQPQADPNTQATIAGNIEIERIRSKAKADATAAQNEIKAAQQNMDKVLQEIAAQSTERMAKLASTIELLKQQQDFGGRQILQEMSANAAEHLAVLNAALGAFTASMQQLTAPGEEGGAPSNTVDEEGRPVPDQRAPAGSIDSPLLSGIKQVLENALREMAVSQAHAAGIDGLRENMVAMLNNERESNQQAFAQLAAGMQALAQERQSEIFIGPDGKKRARHFYPGLQNEQQPNSAPQPPIEGQQQ